MNTPAASIALGIDIGGTSCRAALVDEAGRIVAQSRAPTPERGEPLALVDTLRVLRNALSDGATDVPIGVACPGVWNRATGVMEWAVNLPALVGQRLPDLFRAALGRPVALDNDVNAAALAQWHAAGRPARWVYLSIGTGVGGAAILDGEIVRHTHGGAGHFGFVLIDPATALHAGEPTNSVPPGSLSDFLLPQRGPCARVSPAEALAIACYNFAQLYAPTGITLGGGRMDHDEPLWLATVAAWQRLPHTPVSRAVVLERGAYRSDDAGVIGAAHLARSGFAGKA